MTVAKEFASHLLSLKYEDLPTGAIDNAKKIIVSTLSSAAAGTTIRSAQIVREILQRQGGHPEATAWFSGGRKLPLTSVVRGNAMLAQEQPAYLAMARQQPGHDGVCRVHRRCLARVRLVLLRDFGTISGSYSTSRGRPTRCSPPSITIVSPV